MKIIIEGTEGLPDGLYGSVAIAAGDTLYLYVDAGLDPATSKYPVTKGSFI